MTGGPVRHKGSEGADGGSALPSVPTGPPLTSGEKALIHECLREYEMMLAGGDLCALIAPVVSLERVRVALAVVEKA